MGLALLLGCGDAERSAPESEPTQPAPGPKAPQAQAQPAAEAVGIGVAERGAVHYAVLCASCHGERGDADTPIAVALIPTPARHNDGEYMNALDDEYLFSVIKHGGSAVGKSAVMAAWGGSLTDAQIRDVIAFIRTLADPPYSPPGR
jgi:mono/diheme cytochrome c family protein